MERITFKQFMQTYKFCEINNDNSLTEEEKLTTNIIRVNYAELTDEIISNEKWFEFGYNTWHLGAYSPCIDDLTLVLGDKILSSYISYVKVNAENNIEIGLTKEKFTEDELTFKEWKTEVI